MPTARHGRSEPALILRPAAEADIAAAAAVAARSYRAAFADILDTTTLDVRTPGFFAERFAAALQLLVVAISEGALLGFSLMANRHIDMLFVDPAFQGSGVGPRL